MRLCVGHSYATTRHQLLRVCWLLGTRCCSLRGPWHVGGPQQWHLLVVEGCVMAQVGGSTGQLQVQRQAGEHSSSPLVPCKGGTGMHKPAAVSRFVIAAAVPMQPLQGWLRCNQAAKQALALPLLLPCSASCMPQIPCLHLAPDTMLTGTSLTHSTSAAPAQA